MTEADIRKELKQWIRKRAKLPETREIQDDEAILAQGLLSSLDVTELILFVESLRDEEVDLADIEPKVLTNINTLMQGFFQKWLTA